MRDSPRSLMIFAAGHGTRMRPLTDRMPKPLVPVAGKALIDHALALAPGIERVVVNTHYMAEMLEAHLKDLPVITVHEEQLLETGGGLRNALPLLGDGPVLTLNSDAVWRGPNVLQQLIEAWQPDEMEALLSVTPGPQAVGHAGPGNLSLDQDLRLTWGEGWVYTGAQIIRTGLLLGVAETVFSVRDVWANMMASGTLFGAPYDGAWCDVGQPSSIALAEGLLDV